MRVIHNANGDNVADNGREVTKLCSFILRVYTLLPVDDIGGQRMSEEIEHVIRRELTQLEDIRSIICDLEI